MVMVLPFIGAALDVGRSISCYLIPRPHPIRGTSVISGGAQWINNSALKRLGLDSVDASVSVTQDLH